MTKKNFYIDFNKSLKPTLIIYGAVFLVGIILACILGVNLDINFKGGTRIAYSFTGDISAADAETAISEAISKKATVSFNTDISGNSKQLIVTLTGNSSLSSEDQTKITESLTKKYTDNSIKLYDSTSVSPTIAGTFFAKSLVAVMLAGIIVVIYVGIRFRKIGGVPAALFAWLALIIDCISAFFGCVALGLPLDSNFIAVILTLLGYSLNDTIVIYDRIRENKRLYPEKTLDVLVNESVNSVKIRNFFTTFTTILAIFTIIVVSEIYGLTTLRSFAIPMVFGIVSGCISSLFVSGPLWVKWKSSRTVKKTK